MCRDGDEPPRVHREELFVRVTVLGAGAMGCLFGGRLTGAGLDVVLVDAWPVHVDALNGTGLRVWEGDQVSFQAVRAVAAGAPVRPAELVLLFVKSYRTEQALGQIPPLLAPGGVVLTLQNGLGAGELLARQLGARRVLVGVTAQGATVLGPGEIRHGGAGETLVGGVREVLPHAEKTAEVFSRAGLPTRVVADVAPALWKKLAVNCGINALTALTGIKNGRIPELFEAAALLRQAVREAAAVAAAAGVDLGDPDELAATVLAIAKATGANRSSMGQDVDRRSPTEIDFINGAVVREGKRLGVATPVNETLLLLVKTLEATFP